MKPEFYLQTQDLSVGYNGRALIREISLGIRRGEVVTLIGPNGSGKSTILKSIIKQLKLIDGRVLIDGQELHDIGYKELATKMAVVLTNRLKTELLTCWDIVSSGRYPYTGRMGLLTDEDQQKVEEAMRTVHVLELADRDFRAISDGQRQRIMLARAICQEPEIIVLDEPTSFLDIRHKLELLSVLRTMAKERGITVLLSLHEIDLAEKVSDRLICVKGDRIFKFGTPEEIFRTEIIDELYALDPGAFNVSFGSLELVRPTGEPEVFVLCGGGTGIQTFRRLQKDNIPFAAGVLHENDVDHQVASSLAVQVISEKAFCPISDEAFAQAAQIMLRCKSVICTDFPVGPGNRRQTELKALAEQHGLLK